MNELVIERAALPKELLEWLEAETEQGKSSMLILRQENGRYIFQRAHQPNPKVMASIAKLVDEHASLLKRLADA